MIRKKRLLLFFTLMFLTSFSLFSQSGIEDLYSATFLARGAHSADLSSPNADVLNPAASALRQNPAIDINYLSLAGLGDTQGFGHVFGIGVSVPYQIGVFSGSGRFITSPFASIYPGTMGELNISFSKDLYPDFLVGFGLGAQFGADWGLGLDMGFIHRVGPLLSWNLPLLKDFTWGFALRNIGKGYKPADYSFPSAFTPAFAAHLSVLKTRPVSLDLYPDISFPSFQDINIKAGGEILIFDMVTLQGAYTFDLRDYKNNTSTPASFGISVHLDPLKKAMDAMIPKMISSTQDAPPKNQEGMAVSLSAAPLGQNIWGFSIGSTLTLGFYDQNPPQIEIKDPPKDFSPNYDGVKDEFLIPLTIKDERYITGYELLIKDKNGTTIRKIINKEVRPENEDFKSIVQRFASKKEGVKIPEALRWDGKTDGGSLAEDGTYTWTIEAWDDNGNMAATPPYKVNIDTVYPAISVSAPYTVFSPNGDGRQDTLDLSQSSSEEELWTGQIIGTDKQIIKDFSWENGQALSVIWDGKNNDGILPPDGIYTYLVTSTDRAGNTKSAEIKNIRIITTPTPVNLYLDYADFSPNNDGIKDHLPLRISVPVKEGIARWSLNIKNDTGTVIRSWTGEKDVQEMIEFDGKDSERNTVPEGIYSADLSVLYVGGNFPSAVSPPFSLDITPPNADVSYAYPVFSPNGDKSKDTFQIIQKTSEEVLWEGTITDKSGSPVMKAAWRVKGEDPFTWDGRNTEGALLPDGEYTYTLTSTDKAGNNGSFGPLSVILDTRPTPVRVTADMEAFSPNGDKVKDTLTFKPGITVEDGIESWEFTVTSAAGDTTAIIASGTAFPDNVGWTGKSLKGTPLPDGQYYCTLKVVYLNGNKSEGRTNIFTIDNQFPAANVKTDSKIFSPDNDNRQDTLTFVQNSSTEVLWAGYIKDTQGKTVKSYFWKGTVGNFTWDGRDEIGNIVPDGKYTYTLVSEDFGGNKIEEEINNIQVDTKPTPVSLNVGSKAFSPNKDGVKDILSFKPDLDEKEGVGSWELSILDGAGKSVRTINGTGTVPEEIAFDGKDNRGAVLPEGPYRGHISVNYKKGANPKAESSIVLIDLTPPKAEVSANTNVISPNNDGRKDSVLITQQGSMEEEWAGSIKNREGREIKGFLWKEEPEKTLVWNGKNSSGTPVPDGEYSYTLTSTDAAGNTSVSRNVAIMVDTRDTPLTVTVQPSSFSPNGDREKDTIQILPSVGQTDGIETYTLSILDKNENQIWSTEGKGRIPSSVSWNGRNSNGTPAQDGTYTAEAAVNYNNGNHPVSRSSHFLLDTLKPQLTTSYDSLLFSPDGDRLADELHIRQNSSVEELWEGRITGNQNKIIKTFFWKGGTGELIWDGKDDSGNLVQDGSYVYSINATDNAGNSLIKTITGIIVDTRETPLFMTASEKSFSPNGDGEKDTISFKIYTGLTEGITSWKLVLINTKNGLQKRFEGTAIPPETITWNGMGETNPAENGEYMAAFSIQYAKGNNPRAEAGFILDTAPPKATLRISPSPFSPDNDGIDDELTIDIEVKEDSGIKDWKIDILDPAGNPFTSYSGKGEPAKRIIWEGISDTGELVQAAEDYTLSMTIRDQLGNTSRTEEKVPVDVLVVREGNKLRISISSIIFAPNTSDYKNVEETNVLKNMKTLRRLAEIFKKYSNYKIRIEGHAVSINWNDPALAAKEQNDELIPLSKARAESVKNALVELGIDKNRISTVGIGGANPVVPHGDLTNRWKNRRVDFLLIK